MILYAAQRDLAISLFFWIWTCVFLVQGMNDKWNVAIPAGVIAIMMLWIEKYYYEQVEE